MTTQETKRAAFTPGPWSWAVEDYSQATLFGPREYEDHVLCVSPCKACQERASEPKEWVWGRCTTPSPENARLIAAAPAMFDALEKLLGVTLDALEVECPHCEQIEPGHENYCPIAHAHRALALAKDGPQ